MKLIETATFAEAIPGGAAFACSHGARLTVRLVAPDILRVSLVRAEGWRLDRGWTIAPGGLEPPPEGRPRDALDGFPLAEATATPRAGGATIAGERLVVEVDAAPLRISVRRVEDAAPFAADRPSGAYMLSRRTRAFAHHMLRADGERHYGLGDKAGSIDRTGRRFRLEAVDPMGYDARTSDPLYKVAPFLLCDNPQAGLCYGVLYDCYAAAEIDCGATIDNYHLPFRTYRAEDGDLDYYVILGPGLLDVTRRLDWLVGGTAFPPKWSLGFGLTSMSIADAPDADARIREIVAAFDAHDLPIDSFHFGSGYALHGGKRHVFRWNREKFPDPAATLAALHAAGLRAVTNIKPCLLDDHPDFPTADARGLVVKAGPEPDAGPAISQFWDGLGAHVDFTAPAGVAWWRARMRESLLDEGVDSIWSDNNEYEIWDEDAQAAGFGRPVDLALLRPAQALLMTKASVDEQRDAAPGARPYAVTRAGPIGIGRYAQTWTGDNRTDWSTLRFNLAQGLSMSLSGMSNTGHDVGGFAGPEPDAELLVRFVELCSLWPRMVMNSWKTSGVVTLPWMHPEAIPAVREAMRLRYRLMPMIYAAMWRAASDGTPPIRPLRADFPGDALARDVEDAFMLGDALLVAPVLEEGARARAVALPGEGTWTELHTGARHPAGSVAVVEAPLGRLPVLVREGGMVALSRQLRRIDPARDDHRTLRVHPGADGVSEALFYEDDGLAVGWREGAGAAIRVAMTVEGARLSLEAEREGAWRPAFDAFSVEIVSPRGFREIRLNGREAARGGALLLPI